MYCITTNQYLKRYRETLSYLISVAGPIKGPGSICQSRHTLKRGLRGLGTIGTDHSPVPFN